MYTYSDSNIVLLLQKVINSNNANIIIRRLKNRNDFFLPISTFMIICWGYWIDARMKEKVRLHDLALFDTKLCMQFLEEGKVLSEASSWRLDELTLPKLGNKWGHESWLRVRVKQIYINQVNTLLPHSDVVLRGIRVNFCPLIHIIASKQ